MPSLLHRAAGGGGRGQPATGSKVQARYGADEITCDGGTTSLSMSCYRADPVLHPGRAVVRFELHDAYQGTTLTETTRSVRIPR
ncbi:hypothetical protein M2302_003279 [Micromonospora sp. A200]|uniref:hypothetical protein n=1 Tax=Micromonospora sp. A200 TaxID=2940568 RepID=UPI002473183E|nr:hypothetical protein [Micromonospora sp. A200]MDH6463094.1 hypothetical protein [Micromonospora sp. A200]